MDWLECSERMDRYVIKKDGTAVDIEYFMATHVPFRDLEFFDFGFTGSGVVNQYTIHEEELYNSSVGCLHDVDDGLWRFPRPGARPYHDRRPDLQ